MENFLRIAPREVVLYMLTDCGLSALDLVSLSVTCAYFHQPANLTTNRFLSITEAAAQHLCTLERAYSILDSDGLNKLRWTLGGSWCRLLRYLSDVCMPRRHGKFSISAGTSYSLAIDSLGRVFSWGEGTSGHLGHGDRQTRYCPTQIEAFCGRRAVHMCAGFGHSIVLCDDGGVYTFGDNSALLGFCGFKGQDVIWTPRRIEGFDGMDIVQVCVGSLGGTFQNVVVTRSGCLYYISPQDNNEEPVAQEYDVRTCLAIMAEISLSEKCYKGLCVLQTDAGDGSGYTLSASLKECGQVCQMNGTCLENVHFDWPIKAIAAGNGHCLALTEEGRVFSWNAAAEDKHELGQPIKTHQIEFPHNVKIAHIAAGNNVSFYVDTKGRLYSTGNCQFSGLGFDSSSECDACRSQNPDAQIADHKTFTTPRLIEALAGEKVVQVSSQAICIDCSHTLVLTESGKVFSFGQNEEGQLGRPPCAFPDPIPKPIPNFCLLASSPHSPSHDPTHT